MSWSLLTTIGWILVVSLVGMMPRSQHKKFGFPLLALFPVVLGFLAWELGFWWALGLFLAALSIYRYPARYYGLALWRKITGKVAAE